MSKRIMHCPHKDKISDCPECMAVLNANPKDSEAELDEIFSTLNGSGSHACYCPRSVDGGCECALKDEYLDESKAKLLAWRDRCVAEANPLSTADRVKLLLAQVEIYKLQADGYNWAHTPEHVRQKLEAALVEIDKLTPTEPTHE